VTAMRSPNGGRTDLKRRAVIIYERIGRRKKKRQNALESILTAERTWREGEKERKAPASRKTQGEPHKKRKEGEAGLPERKEGKNGVPGTVAELCADESKKQKKKRRKERIADLRSGEGREGRGKCGPAT